MHPSGPKLFPGLDGYLSVLNKAVILSDEELVNYVCRKIVDLLGGENRQAVIM